jgi:hypothetical protein
MTVAANARVDNLGMGTFPQDQSWMRKGSVRAPRGVKRREWH